LKNSIPLRTPIKILIDSLGDMNYKHTNAIEASLVNLRLKLDLAVARARGESNDEHRI
jgi:hypothetical protein